MEKCKHCQRLRRVASNCNMPYVKCIQNHEPAKYPYCRRAGNPRFVYVKWLMCRYGIQAFSYAFGSAYYVDIFRCRQGRPNYLSNLFKQFSRKLIFLDQNKLGGGEGRTGLQIFPKVNYLTLRKHLYRPYRKTPILLVGSNKWNCWIFSTYFSFVGSTNFFSAYGWFSTSCPIRAPAWLLILQNSPYPSGFWNMWCNL